MEMFFFNVVEFFFGNYADYLTDFDNFEIYCAILFCAIHIMLLNFN